LIHEDLRNSIIPDGIKRKTSLCSVLYGVNSQSRRNSVLGIADVGSTFKLNNTAQIVKHASVLQFDIVLMDNSMPKMSGPDATLAMRTLGFQGPIIGITGHEDTTEFILAGADIVLCKPINRKVLYDTMKAMMKGERIGVDNYLSVSEDLEDSYNRGQLPVTDKDKGFKWSKDLSGVQRRRCSTERTHNSFVSNQNSCSNRLSFLSSNYGISASSDSTASDNYTVIPVPLVPDKIKKRSLFLSKTKVGSSYNLVKISALKEQNEFEDHGALPLSVEESDVIYQAGKNVSSLSPLSSFKSNEISLLREENMSRKNSLGTEFFKDRLENEDDKPRDLSLSLQNPISLTHSLTPIPLTHSLTPIPLTPAAAASEICEAV
jgi:CheY-like chemotaxis protein